MIIINKKKERKTFSYIRLFLSPLALTDICTNLVHYVRISHFAAAAAQDTRTNKNKFPLLLFSDSSNFLLVALTNVLPSLCVWSDISKEEEDKKDVLARITEINHS